MSMIVVLAKAKIPPFSPASPGLFPSGKTREIHPNPTPA